MRKDNASLEKKVAIRRSVLERMRQSLICPVVMETHGGLGAVWDRCYREIEIGVVLEKDPYKSERLAKQRPTWSVYEADCEKAIRSGAGSHLQITLLDVDPYGEPWPVLDAFFGSERHRPPILWVVVNDGLRNKTKLGGAHAVKSLEGIVEKAGNGWIYRNYLECCQMLLEEKASKAGYHLARFTGYYCGYEGIMTHYAARLDLEPTAAT